MTTPNDRQRQAFEAFKKAWEEYPSQDNEGYVPDRGGFKCGWFAALQWADSTPAPSDVGDEEAALKKYMQINDFESALRTRPDKGAIYTNEIIIGWIEDTFKHARRAQNAEVTMLRELVMKHEDFGEKMRRENESLRALLERAIKYALTATEYAPELKIGVSSIIEECGRIKESK